MYNVFTVKKGRNTKIDLGFEKPLYIPPSGGTGPEGTLTPNPPVKLKK